MITRIFLKDSARSRFQDLLPPTTNIMYTLVIMRIITMSMCEYLNITPEYYVLINIDY